LIVAIHLGEKAARAFGRNVQLDVVGVDAGAGLLEVDLVEVRGQDLDGEVDSMIAEIFQQANGQRVNLLAGGTARHPDANGRVGRTVLDQTGKNRLLQGLERLLVAEEAGDANEEVLVKVLQFARIGFETVQIVGDVVEAEQGHAAANAAVDRGPLVLGGIDVGAAARRGHDLVDRVVFGKDDVGRGGLGGYRGGRPPPEVL